MVYNRQIEMNKKVKVQFTEYAKVKQNRNIFTIQDYGTGKKVTFREEKKVQKNNNS